MVAAAATLAAYDARGAAPASQPATAPAVALPPGVQMHRLQVGEPDADGWCLARSTKGGFSVAIPHRFNDFTIAPKTKDDTPLNVHAIGALTPSGTKYTAMKMMREDGKVDGNVDDIAKGFGKDLKSERRITHGGLEGVEFSVGNARTAAIFRCFHAGGSIVQLIVEYPRRAAGEAEANAQRFFDSFVDDPKTDATTTRPH
jgi:hypothetical protein